jgi:pimeloyl-ACP methyl ester carboxylesterase
MRRLGLAVALLALAPAAAHAAHFRPCGGGIDCARLTVPLDRTGEFIPPTLTTPLYVVRERATHATRPPVVLVTGGPGQAGTDLLTNAGPGGPFDPDRLHRDVIAFDPRGTGDSGLLRCPPLEHAKSFLATDAAAACWASLGAGRYAYTSRTVADDIDTIRQTIGAPQLALYGISYGTSVAQTYARVYPQHVERLILDSTVEPGGGDMLYRPTFAATGRVLQALCAGSRCRRAGSADPVADFAALVHSLPATGLRGRTVGADGRLHPFTLTRFDLLDVLIDGDFDPGFRGNLPAAVHSAVAGDPAALLRLARAALKADESDFTQPRDLSIADYAATVCEEGPFLWDRTAGPDARRAQVAAAVAAIPPASLLPWDPQSPLESDFLATCLKWPATPQAPDLGGAYPDVPVLVLSGEDDLRTPLEGARVVAANYPRAILRTFSHVGHDVVDGPALGCASRDVRRFLGGRSVPSCPAAGRAPDIVPAAPRSVADVPRRHRARTIARLILEDAFNWAPGDGVVTPGLRGGRLVLTSAGARLDRYVYVPGVRVSGTVRQAVARLRLTGAVRARVTLALRP